MKAKLLAKKVANKMVWQHLCASQEIKGEGLQGSQTLRQRGEHLWGQTDKQHLKKWSPCTLVTSQCSNDQKLCFNRLWNDECIHQGLDFPLYPICVCILLAVSDTGQVNPRCSHQPKFSFFRSSGGRSEQNSSLIIFWVLRLFDAQSSVWFCFCLFGGLFKH